MRRLIYPLKSISTRFSLLVLIIASASIGFFLVFTAVMEKKRMTELASSQADTMAKFVRSILLCGMKEAKHKKILHDSLKDTNLVAQFRNNKGQLIFSSIRNENTVPQNKNCPLGEIFSIIEKADGYDDDTVEYAKIVPLPNEGECASCHEGESEILGTLEIRMPAHPIRTLIHDLQIPMVITGGVSVAVVVIAVLLLFAKLFHRLEVLKEKMRQVGKGDLSVIAPEIPGDEVGELGQAFNSLVQQLGKAREEIEKAHQKELNHLEKLIAVGELATGIVHELKNPLAAVSATVQSLRKDLPPNDPNTEVFDEIIFEVNAASSILQNLLQFGKQSEPVLAPTNITQCIKEVLSVISEQTKNGNINLASKLEPDLPEIQADVRLLQQVLLNIIMNAIQAKQKGLELKIEAIMSESVEKTESLENDGLQKEIAIRISDNGPGIAPANLEKVFRPFFTTRPKGTGLGLAISKTIIEKHNGNISVQSALGKGTTFEIRLPVNIEQG